jgi:hypothetical protein
MAWIQDFISAGVVAMAVRGREKPAAFLLRGLGIWLGGLNAQRLVNSVK